MKKTAQRLIIISLIIFAVFILVLLGRFFYIRYQVTQRTATQLTSHLQIKSLNLELADGKTYDDLSKEKYVTVLLTDPDNPDHSEECKIKIHGNYTATLPKKSIRLKCPDRTQVLLANHTDKTLLRNFLALEIADLLSFPYVVNHHQFVNLSLNDQPFGSYLLTDHVGSTAPTQLGLTYIASDSAYLQTDVSSSAQTSPASLVQEPDFPFLIEISDHLFNEPLSNSLFTVAGTPIEIKYPDEDDLTDDHFTQLNTYFNQLEDVLLYRSPTSFGDYFDLETAASWYLLNELVANPDGGKNSIYLSKKPGELIKYGPAWDFDLTFGNYDKPDVSVNPDQLPVLATNLWLQKLHQSSAFQREVQRQYQSVDWSLLSLALDRWSQDLNQSQASNFQVWPVLNEYIHPSPYILGDYQSEIQALQSWLRQRLEFFDTLY